MSNPNLIRSSKTVRKTLPSGEIQETTVTTMRPPQGGSRLQPPGQGVCPGSIPRPTGSIPRPASQIARPASGIPTSGIPTSRIPSSGIPTSRIPTGGIPTSRMPPGGMPTSGLQRPTTGYYAPPSQGSGIPGLQKPTQPRIQSISSKTTIVQPDGSKTVTKKTQIMKPPSGASPGGAPFPARASMSPTRGPPPSTGAIRRLQQLGTKLTRTTATSGVDPEGRRFKKSTTTVSIKDSPAGAAKSPVRPADVSQVNIQRDPLNLSQLERAVSKELIAQSAATGQGRAKATKVEKTSVPMMMTPVGSVPVDKQVIVETKLNRSPDGEQVHRHVITTARKPDNTHERIEIAGQTMSPADLQAEAAKLGVAPHDLVAIQSTTSVGGGYKQKTTKIVYETDRPHIGDDSQMNPKDVAEMIEEENNDLDEILRIMPPPEVEPEPEDYPLRKKIKNLQLSSVPVEILEKDVELPPPTGDEELPELQPELIATIMHTEEEGLVIESQPHRVYNYLFPEDKVDKFANASSAAPAVVQDVVVPLLIPNKLEASAMSDELQAATAAIHNVAIPPTENAYAETANATGPKSKNIAKPKKRKAKPIAEEQPPWSIEDMQVIADLVGAEPASPLIEEEIDLTVAKDPANQGIDFFLELHGPRHVSRVQLRGSQNPPWFPGYIVALPTIPDLVRVERTPNTILSSAWRAVQPNVFAEDSFLII